MKYNEVASYTENITKNMKKARKREELGKNIVCVSISTRLVFFFFFFFFLFLMFEAFYLNISQEELLSPYLLYFFTYIFKTK